MEIICLYIKKKADSIYHKSEFIAFFKPAWEGNHIVEASLLIPIIDIENYKNITVYINYKDAHKAAHITQMSEDDYNASYI